MARAASSAPSSPPAKRVPVAVKILGAWLATMVALYAGWTGWTMYQLRAAKARVHAAGLPTTLAQLQPPTIPDDVNARVLFEEIGARAKQDPLAAWLKTDDVGWLRTLRSGPPRRLTDAEQFKLSGMLEGPAPKYLLEAALKAAVLQGYWPKVDYYLEKGTLDPQLGQIVTVVELLGARARLAASRGNRAAAANDLSAALALASFPTNEPSLLAQMTTWGALGVVTKSIQHVAHLRGLPAENASDFASRLRRLTPHVDLAHALDSERVLIGAWSFERILGGKQRGSTAASLYENRPLGALYAFSGAGRLDYAAYLDRMRELRVELANPAHSPREQMDALHRITGHIPRYQVMTALTLPTIDTIAQRAWVARMHAAVTEVGLALERYRGTQGKYPEELAVLVPDYLPELPRDAFTSQPLVYRGTRDAALVYSLGPNAKDDEGEADAEKKRDDIAWSVGGD